MTGIGIDFIVGGTLVRSNRVHVVVGVVATVVVVAVPVVSFVRRRCVDDMADVDVIADVVTADDVDSWLL